MSPGICKSLAHGVDPFRGSGNGFFERDTTAERRKKTLPKLGSRVSPQIWRGRRGDSQHVPSSTPLGASQMKVFSLHGGDKGTRAAKSFPRPLLRPVRIYDLSLPCLWRSSLLSFHQKLIQHCQSAIVLYNMGLFTLVEDRPTPKAGHRYRIASNTD